VNDSEATPLALVGHVTASTWRISTSGLHPFYTHSYRTSFVGSREVITYFK